MDKKSEIFCPQCKTKLVAIIDPDPADVTVCVNCTALLQFDDELKLKMLSIDDYDKLPQDIRKDLFKAQSIIIDHRMKDPE